VPMTLVTQILPYSEGSSSKSIQYSGSLLGRFALPRAHGERSGDIFGCMISSWEELHVSGGQRAQLLLNVLQCTGQSPRGW
jgi:hypothetical protein